MKRISKYIFLANDEKEYDEYVEKSLKDACDVSFYLNLLKSKSSQLLLEIIDFNMEFFDSKNVCVDCTQIKKDLGLIGNFAKLVNKDKPFDKDNISINLNSITLSNEDASEKAKEIHDIIFKSVLNIKNTKISF